jgi:3,4-dihydroxy 2-butanone 4-phosphate synthase/GTP cyclohydrolase II
VVAGSRPADRHGLSTIDEAIAAMRAGEMILVVDDHDRENEGDLVMAADLVTPAAVNFMVTHGRGLLCLALTSKRCADLDLPPMVPATAGNAETNFTVSIDFEAPGSTGISAPDRARTIRHAMDAGALPSDFRRPGHVFPLQARDGGVLERAGHTEASVDLARLAGLTPAGVICEVMNPDGTMARLPQLLELAERHRFHLITIADLIEYRRRHETLVQRVADATLPTAYGPARAVGFRDHTDTEHIAVCFGDVTSVDEPLVRVHSECLTGDVLGSRRCDCGAQLDAAMATIAAEGTGVVVYVRGHEGRGIGLLNKLRAYELQDDGHDTVEANLALGHQVDERDFLPAAQMLRSLGLARVRLLTNNPAKIVALRSLGIEVASREPLEVAPHADNTGYLATKRAKLGHHLSAFDSTVLDTTA